MRVIISGMQTGVLVAGDNAVTPYECVGDRILHTICCSRTMDLGLHIAVHARKKSFLRHTARLVTDYRSLTTLRTSGCCTACLFKVSQGWASDQEPVKDSN